MSVHVSLLPTALPKGYEDADRVIHYEDRTDGDGPFHCRYSLHESGSLVVWRIAGSGPNAPKQIEVTYSPSAWESVQGDIVRKPGTSPF